MVRPTELPLKVLNLGPNQCQGIDFPRGDHLSKEALWSRNKLYPTKGLPTVIIWKRTKLKVREAMWIYLGENELNLKEGSL